MIYERATWTSKVGRCQPGTTALLDYIDAQPGLGNVGCFNDRTVRGSTTTPSVHREGRAVDATEDWHNPAADLDGLIAKLIAHYEQLGCQQIIWQRQYWRCDAGPGWHPYHGTDPHTSHAHIELTWGAAGALTIGAIAAVLGTPSASAPPLTITTEEVDEMATTIHESRPRGDGRTQDILRMPLFGATAGGMTVLSVVFIRQLPRDGITEVDAKVFCNGTMQPIKLPADGRTVPVWVMQDGLVSVDCDYPTWVEGHETWVKAG